MKFSSVGRVHLAESMARNWGDVCSAKYSLQYLRPSVHVKYIPTTSDIPPFKAMMQNIMYFDENEDTVILVIKTPTPFSFFRQLQ